MAEPDYADLLERTRQGMPRDELAPVMPALLDVNNDFENPTKLRLLGNAIANNKPNAAALQNTPEAIDRLLALGPLGLQILYNGCVENKEFSAALAQKPGFAAQLPPTPVARMLCGAMFEALGSERFPDFEAQLVVSGFVELVLSEPTLEQHPIVVQNFARVYEHCQKLTQAECDSLEAADEFSALGFQVVGNISAHAEFGLAQVADVPAEPYTWDTVALLANLTAAKANLEAVFAKWPELVPNTVALVKSEDADEDVDEDNNADADEDDNADDSAVRKVPIKRFELGPLMNETCDEEDYEFGRADDVVDPDVPYQPPFDLNLWGSLFRNVARHAPAARQLAQHAPAKLVSRLLESPLLQELAWDFASMFAANCYDHDVTELVTQSPYSGGTVLVGSSAAQGLLAASDVAGDEAAWAAPQLAHAISEGLSQTGQPPVWVKGTRALALLRAAHADLVSVDVERLAAAAPQDEAVQANLEALRST